jgi:SWI/SNF-related matrix-associated actin-dependent regulator of chromatin subfamily A member 2/4
MQNVTEQPSILSGGKLLPYQLAGLNFMINLYDNGLSGILADEMGLGKTIQTIAFLAYLKEHRQCFGPHIVIAPLSTLPNWINEFARWCPCLDILEFRGNKQERRMLGHKLRRQTFHVCVTTYDWVLREKSILSAPYWSLLIVDEGHRLKNIRSKFHVTLTEFRSTHRVLLTGTPLQNNLSELWSLLNFLLPNIFSSSLDFEMWFEQPYKASYSLTNSSAEETFVLSEEEKFLIINTLHSVLRPFLLRRVKEDVLDELPHKKEYNVRIALSSWQKRAYEHISSRAIR